MILLFKRGDVRREELIEKRKEEKVPLHSLLLTLHSKKVIAMTDLENKVHDIDKRQENFETFIKEHIRRLDYTIERMDRRMEETNERMKEMGERMDRRMEEMDERINKRMDRLEERQDQLDAKREADNARIDAKFAQMDQKMDNLSAQMHNLMVAGGVGVLTIIVALFFTR